MNEQQVEEALKGLQAQLHSQQKFVTATLVEDVKELKEQMQHLPEIILDLWRQFRTLQSETKHESPTVEKGN